MPYANVKITRSPDVTRERKAALAAGINQFLVDVLNKQPEHIHIHVVIDEIDEENWGFAGVLTTDYRNMQTG